MTHLVHVGSKVNLGRDHAAEHIAEFLVSQKAIIVIALFQVETQVLDDLLLILDGPGHLLVINDVLLAITEVRCRQEVLVIHCLDATLKRQL